MTSCPPLVQDVFHSCHCCLEFGGMTQSERACPSFSGKKGTFVMCLAAVPFLDETTDTILSHACARGLKVRSFLIYY